MAAKVYSDLAEIAGIKLESIQVFAHKNISDNSVAFTL